EAWVGRYHLADVRLNRAERIIGRLRRRRRRQRVEQRRFADVGEAENAAYEAHEVTLTITPRVAHSSASSCSLGATNPLACMPKCTLFWKLASWPCTSSSALSAMIAQSASTHRPSSFANPFSPSASTTSF